ncbi:MAG: hypothetical protein RLN79_08075 [Cytophagales bacterium]
MMDKLMSKNLIINELLIEIENKISSLNHSIEQLKESLFNETKSSMGDKYETSRSIIQTEIEQYHNQYEVLVRHKNSLKMILRQSKNKHTDFGSLIISNKDLFLLGPGLGKKMIKNHLVYCISMHSPIGKILNEVQVGSSFNFNGELLKVKSIE